MRASIHAVFAKIYWMNPKFYKIKVLLFTLTEFDGNS